MSDRLHDRLRSALARRVLPPAPATLHQRLASITATTPVRSRPVSDRFARPRLMLGAAAVLAGTLAIAVLGSGGDRSTEPSTPPVIMSVDGLPVMTVSEAIDARDAGGLPGGRVAIGGFWSGTTLPPGCPAPKDLVGDLEIYCTDGWFGITERNAPILGIERTSTSTRAWQNEVGPRLTPYVPPGLPGAEELDLPIVDGQVPEPVPIIVVGHFDDPRAADCRPEARQLCRDRLVLDRIVQFGTSVIPTPLVPPDTTPSSEASDMNEVDGLPVMTVSEALAAHEASGLPDGRVAMHGYWTAYQVMHTCVPPPPGEQPGELELRCNDGEFGITERNEPIWVVDIRRGQVTYTARGPHLTPWIPNDLPRIEELFTLPFINGQWYPPVPIVVVGHFDDERAMDCRLEAQQLCRDRLVIDRIMEFEPGAVPTPGVTPP